jgi:hypothetical protein
MKNQFKDNENFEILLRKGIYPYEFMDSFEKFNETSLPSKDNFYSTLTNSQVSENEYAYAQNVWSNFKINNMKEYTLLYLKTDILILADIFENFRLICQNNYNLDPLHFLTAPSLSFSAMLKSTKVKIELITDIEMMSFIQKNIRGGIVQCSKKFAKANNKYLDEYDINQQSSYLVYVDKNNLYGWALSQALPIRNYSWVEPVNWSVEKIFELENDHKFGFIFEVDLDYPAELHDDHNDLPLAVQNISSPFNKSKSNCKKLILNFSNKKNYVCHFRVLKQCLKNGLKLKKIHRVLCFEQEPFIKKYIDFNTNLRSKAKNDFEKDFYKLLNNSIYGKTLQNVMKHIEIKFVSKYDNKITRQLNIETLSSNPFFHSFDIINENFAIIQMHKSSVKFDKPIVIGFSVLEISKTLMYDFNYNFMKKQYKDKFNLLYMDTDSFIYEIFTDDFYKDMKSYLDEFDTSNFSPTNQFGIPIVNNKKIGLMKVETGDKVIKRFVGLRSKMYSIDIQNDHCIKKAKGVNKNVVASYNFDTYLNVLKNKSTILNEMYRIKAEKHKLYTTKINKITLNYFDDKRYTLGNNIDTLAWYHYRISD